MRVAHASGSRERLPTPNSLRRLNETAERDALASPHSSRSENERQSAPSRGAWRAHARAYREKRRFRLRTLSLSPFERAIARLRAKDALRVRRLTLRAPLVQRTGGCRRLA